ncbi:unnamed protein product, partial [Mesorhabditis belari]|uniref:Transthyretin-like family protein n=1 Tax=Mesorhabditis belari TaxID=2138241 RepID=A0AAF3FSZ2_9BILA
MKLLILAALLGVTLAKVSTITVKGITVCNKKRVPGLKVELMEEDGVTRDDKLATVTTDGQGNFEVSGQDDEWGTIEPYLYVYHKCRILKEGCWTRTKYEVSSSKINGVYDMTYVTLDVVQAEEDHVC